MILKEQVCPTCSALLRSSSSIEYCPRCLMDQALLFDIGDDGGKSIFLPPEELQPFFPEFEIMSFIGAGGMGLVYRAQQKKLDREVALKIVPDDHTNPEFAERFEREARALARLNHPDFVQIYDHGRVEGWFYIAMEFVDGADLGSVLKSEGQLEPVRAHRLISRLLESLSLAHQQGIVHRDLKPANLILAGEVLKVADFGLAKLQDGEGVELSLTGDDAALGTPYFISPEQREGSRDVDQRTDLYSVGVILYQAVTGVIPTGRYEPASKLSPVTTAFDKVIAKALQPRPGERFQSSLAMKEALDRSLETPSRLPSLVVGAILIVTSIWWVVARTWDETAPPETKAYLRDRSGVITLSAPEGSPTYFGNFTKGGQDWLFVGAPDEGFFEGEAKVPGKAFVYRMEDGAPVLHQTLISPSPMAGDLFGSVIAFSPWEDLLAIASRDAAKVTHYHLFSMGGDHQWQLDQTLVLDLEQSVEEIAPRVILGPGELVVTSPGSIPEKAILDYRRDGSGRWIFRSYVVPKTRFNDKAKIGFQAEFHRDQLFVTASGYNKGLAMRSGGMLIFEEVGEGWQEAQFLEKPATQAFEYFGFDFGFSAADRILVSGLMTKQEDVSSTGSVSEFQRNGEGRWEFLSQLDPRNPGTKQKLFGQQVVVSGDKAMVFSALGSITKPDLKHVRSRAHICERAEDGFWYEKRTLDSEGKGDSWLGKATALPAYFVIPNPARNEVYLVPKSPGKGD